VKKHRISRTVVSVGAAIVALTVIGCAGPVDLVAHEAFLGALGSTSITVFPAYVRDGQQNRYEDAAAPPIGQLFVDEDLATVTVSEEHVPITGPWHSNQAKMLTESAEAFASYLAEHPVATEYALLPEYLLLGGSGAVGGIHCYIVDAENRLAYVVLLNSHWDVFIEMNPQTVADCTPVLIEALREDLLDDGSGG
jgi:hypothetical protein